MIQINDTLVSLDVVERYFECDLDTCLGECCIEGDAGAPLLPEEKERLDALMPEVMPYLSPAAQEVAREQGASYIDEEGDLVTSIVNGKDCIFTTYAPGGKCLCVLEKLRCEGREEFFKPISCSLYPIRLKDYGGMTAVNYHRWKICKCAEILGRKNGVRVYEFLKEPLIRRFGERWYEELALTAKEWLKQQPKDKNS
ncbi:MAG: DUF3109 family protein [Muribaculaceae bacterium]|nr:DUF3109 family protein [Muribaculaceae bacterium]